MKQLKNGFTLQAGKYKIISILGQGGFGITYLAEQTMLERKVAIKEFFMPELCERDETTSYVNLGTEGSHDTVNRFLEKFLKEARNIAKLNHPNIVRIIDVFEENGTAYYVMEYCENGSLAGKVKDRGYMSEPVATRYIIQMAEALDYIHQRRLNHLDVKPANIMLNEKDDAVLIDFGLSKQYNASGQQTSTTPVGISEGYAPMEQYKQGGVGEFSPETDIYALGATFFKLLTGVTPPSASDVNEDGVPVDELKAKGVSQKTINIICKAMESRKRDRMKNVRLFIDGLQGDSTSATQSDDEVTVFTPDNQRVAYERKRKEAEAKAAKEKAETDARTKAEAERKRQQEEAAKSKRNKTILWIFVAVIGIALASIGINALSSGSSASQKTEVNTPSEVKDKTIVLTHGHESKRYYVYSGAVNADGVPNGQGTAQYPEMKSSSSSVYTGTFVNGIPSNGEMKFSTGEKYKGEFDKDGYYTKGTYWDCDGYYFVGTFGKGQPYNGTWYDSQGREDSKVVNGN